MTSLDRIGSIGALLAAIAVPCCFPLFAAIGTAAGLGVLGQYEGIILYVFQGFAVIALIGLVLSFLEHRKVGPFYSAHSAAECWPITFTHTFR